MLPTFRGIYLVWAAGEICCVRDLLPQQTLGMRVLIECLCGVFFREGDDPIVWLYLLIPSLVWPTTGINSLINTFFQECNTKPDFHPENRLVSSHDLPLQQLVDIDGSKTGPSTAQWRPIRKLLPN